jgi:hypothetical protein
MRDRLVQRCFGPMVTCTASGAIAVMARNGSHYDSSLGGVQVPDRERERKKERKKEREREEGEA